MTYSAKQLSAGRFQLIIFFDQGRIADDKSKSGSGNCRSVRRRRCSAELLDRKVKREAVWRLHQWKAQGRYNGEPLTGTGR